MRPRKVTLPSGRTIEVRYHDKAPEVQDLTACPSCRRDFVYPVDWEEASLTHWQVDLRCPNCEWTDTGLFDQATCDQFDNQLVLQTETLVRDLFRMTKANMKTEADRFAAALAVDAIRPEDF